MIPMREDLDPHDHLPVQKHEMVTTESLKMASLAAKMTLDLRGILVIDGPSGTGKTSTATWIARQQTGWRWAYLQVPHNVKFDDVPGHVQEAITGQPAYGRIRDIQRENVRLLRAGHIAFIADEIQYAGLRGIQALRYLADLTAMDPSGAAPMFLVGHGTLNAVSAAPEMLDRLTGTVEFQRLVNGRLLEVVHELHPRLAVTPDDVIGRLDTECAGAGSLRSWHIIIELLERVSPTARPDQPVTGAEVARIGMFRSGLVKARG